MRPLDHTRMRWLLLDLMSEARNNPQLPFAKLIAGEKRLVGQAIEHHKKLEAAGPIVTGPTEGIPERED